MLDALRRSHRDAACSFARSTIARNRRRAMSTSRFVVASCGAFLIGSLACSGGGGSSTSTDRQALGSASGSGGDMPAYYDGALLTINFKELPPGGESSNLQHNGSINTIYQCDQCEANGMMFVSVLDAIQGDGFNPLWNEVQITFAAGATMKQFTRDDDITAAAAAGTITLTPTTEVYRCSVVGPKK
jgi:hypothetical protein